MTYEAMNYEHLKGGALKGFSDSQLELHFTLYKGYLAKLNEIEEKLTVENNTKPNYSFNEYSELKRREAVAFNGSFLHELYFENLGADATTAPDFQKAMDAQGGRDKILADLKATALGGPGWALLTRNRRDGRLHTYFVAEHHLGMPIDQDLLLVLDSWEHAFMVDFGIKRPDYINAFFDNVKWSEVSRRFSAATRHDQAKRQR
ncbi:superoxide dismutase [Geothrix limicola]|uniref:superoxide dismutase n=1 Tax=Geothrix limicola TaxID=2927978 RepID=A0ABQ5QD12_9BACT|nr:Fe-Mn family superoxide dismutase [Geothrix limicola]GLH72221.1 superoxide dismutase [Geothrix limicola]